MFFRSLLRPNQIAKSFGMKGGDEFRMEQEPLRDDDGKQLLDDEGEPAFVEVQKGSYGLDKHHKHLYLRAKEVAQDGTITLSAAPSFQKLDPIMVEVNPNATMLGLFTPNQILKQGDTLTCFCRNPEKLRDKVLELPWIVRISAIAGTKERR